MSSLDGSRREFLSSALLLGVSTGVGGCALSSNHGADSSRVGEFHKIVADYFKTKWEEDPLAAVALGRHEYDGQFNPRPMERLNSYYKRIDAWSARCASMDVSHWKDSDRWDWNLLKLEWQRERLSYAVLKSHRRNPMNYASILDVSIYLKRNFSPLKERIRHVSRVLSHATELFANARANLDSQLPRPYVETAIQISNGTADFLQKELADVVKTLPPRSAEVLEFSKVQPVAIAELRGFTHWLESDRLANSTPEFAVGIDAFTQLLQTELIDKTPREILDLGMRELDFEQQRFAAAAHEIDSNSPPADVYKAIQKDHPTEKNLLRDTRQNLEQIRKYVVDHRLVTIPSEERVRVEETLPPFRATSFASMETPGPYEKKAKEAYYYVTPVEAGWPDAQKEEWLTAFNVYTTDVVSIHEAYPGHYVHFLSLNASKASETAKLLTSYAFTEGWAHYCEQMVIEEGYGQPVKGSNDRAEILRGAKYRLAQSGEALLRLCRLCCAVRMHCFGMSVDEATRFFVANAHYEEKPARSEAMRGTYDPGYGFYTLGKLQLLKLRSDLRAQAGAHFDQQKFHDELLASGAPPIRMLRERWLRDSTQWADVL